MIDKSDLNQLASMIVENIKKEFNIKHLSKNLVNNIVVAEYNENTVKIYIPAEIYDIGEYKKSRVIKHTYRGSYANQLNEQGSPYGNHKDFVNKAINDALSVWKNSYIGRYRMTIK